MLDQLFSNFRKISGIVCLVGVIVTFYALAFAHIPFDKAGRPKPPMRTQLLQTGAVFAAGLPGVIWGVVRAVQNKQKTPWE